MGAVAGSQSQDRAWAADAVVSGQCDAECAASLVTQRAERAAGEDRDIRLGDTGRASGPGWSCNTSHPGVTDDSGRAHESYWTRWSGRTFNALRALRSCSSLCSRRALQAHQASRSLLARDSGVSDHASHAGISGRSNGDPIDFRLTTVASAGAEVDALDLALGADTKLDIFRMADARQRRQNKYCGSGRTDQPTPSEFKGSRHVDALHFLLPSGPTAFRSRFHCHLLCALRNQKASAESIA